MQWELRRQTSTALSHGVESHRGCKELGLQRPHGYPHKNCTLYLGLSGVLHPSRTTFRLVHGREPEEFGHAEFEGTGCLEDLLEPWPYAHILLTSTLPAIHGVDAVLQKLGPSIARQVVGTLFEDLTTKMLRGRRARPMSVEDYWRCNTSELVRTHVHWSKPDAWIAINDDSVLWTVEEREHHFVDVDGGLGLMHDLAAQSRMWLLLDENFRSS